MLGATDPSHIMRTIEYWDIERRRYPAYDHVGVLVAEDITSRFLNLIALLSGSIPLIAIQMRALRVDDKIVLHFARVLDQTELRTDDEYELGERDDGGTQVNRGWWEQKVPATILDLGEEIVAMASQAAGRPCRMQYLKRVINIVTGCGRAAGLAPREANAPSRRRLRRRRGGVGQAVRRRGPQRQLETRQQDGAGQSHAGDVPGPQGPLGGVHKGCVWGGDG
jgi:hypothetical protein